MISKRKLSKSRRHVNTYPRNNLCNKEFYREQNRIYEHKSAWNQASGASSSKQITTEIINQTTSGEIEQAENQPSISQEEPSQVERIQPNTVSENLPAQLNQSTTTNSHTSVANANHTISNSSYGMSRLLKLALYTYLWW